MVLPADHRSSLAVDRHHRRLHARLMAPPSTCDVLVFGATAPAIVAAVRCARQGLRVCLVTPGDQLGGALPSLGALETHYRGVRAPLLEEFRRRVVEHYRDTEGIGSAAYATCTGGRMTTFEPRVAEQVLRSWVESEPLLQWRPGWRVAAVARSDRRIAHVEFGRETDTPRLRVSAAIAIDGSYEGDLMATAGTPYRIGREGRSEYGEPRAGRVFTRWLTGTYPRAAAAGRLALSTAGATTSEPLPGSTGAGDDAVQSASYRLCLTDDPANRRECPYPPDGYDRSAYAPLLLPPAEKERLHLPFHHRFLVATLEDMAAGDHLFHGHALPRRKRSWNATNLTGGAHGYAQADAAGRRAIAQRHRDHALGLLWFLQHDPAVPAAIRAEAQRWGLAADEFTDSGGFPHQLYLRETRRMLGRAVFTEHDALLEPGKARAPVHADSIGFTEFSLDSLACTPERLPGHGTLADGQLFQMEVSRPGQVPYGVLLPPHLDDLLVVTTVSATHVAWGAVRQTPTLMHLAESAAWAAVEARRRGLSPGELPVDVLQRQLLRAGVALAFANDCDMATAAPWLAGVQWAATRGCFESYDIQPHKVLDADTENRWHSLGLTPADTRNPTSGAAVTHGEACRRWFDRTAGPGPE
jgi:hypothetical protein